MSNFVHPCPPIVAARLARIPAIWPREESIAGELLEGLAARQLSEEVAND